MGDKEKQYRDLEEQAAQVPGQRSLAWSFRAGLVVGLVVAHVIEYANSTVDGGFLRRDVDRPGFVLGTVIALTVGAAVGAALSAAFESRGRRNVGMIVDAIAAAVAALLSHFIVYHIAWG
jgi:uncharacterized transporter YbjL